MIAVYEMCCAEGEKQMGKRILAAVGGCAVTFSALFVGLAVDSGQAVAGSGNGAVNTFVQPAPPAMSMGPTTTTLGRAPTALATTLAVPPVTAARLGPECSMPNRCP